jgi:hypothetical protein
MGHTESFFRSDPHHQQEGDHGMPERSTRKRLYFKVKITTPFLKCCHPKGWQHFLFIRKRFTVKIKSRAVR